MDYITKATSRRNLRKLAPYLRKIFDVPPDGPFPVLEVLEKLPDVFNGCNYIIVDDSKLPPQTMAQCAENDIGGYTIEIKESVYRGAFERHTGAFLGFICHKISCFSFHDRI